jgi:hypothetical protein
VVGLKIMLLHLLQFKQLIKLDWAANRYKEAVYYSAWQMFTFGLRVEKVVKIVDGLCKSQKSRVANIYPLTKVIYTKCYQKANKSCIFLFLGKLGCFEQY